MNSFILGVDFYPLFLAKWENILISKNCTKMQIKDKIILSDLGTYPKMNRRK